MSDDREQIVLKLVAKVLNHKRVNAVELTTKRGSQMFHEELLKNNFHQNFLTKKG